MTGAGLTVGLDAGTGSVKAVLFDPDLGVIGRGASSYPTSLPHPDWAEQDPDEWWDAAGTAVRQALAEAGCPGAEVTAIAVSAMGGAVVYLDGLGRPVRPALINMDRRAAAEQRQLGDGPFATALQRSGGNRVGAWNVAARTAWLRRSEPDVYAAIRTITSPAGYVLHRCTGTRALSVSDAGIFDLFDLRRRSWSRDACAALGIDPALLPPIVPSLTRLGPLTSGAAEHMGLTTACTVVAGGEDTSSAAFAAGANEDGIGYVSLGTAGVVGVVTTPKTDPQPCVLRFPHVLAGRDLLSGSMSAAGAALAWLGELTGRTPADLAASADAVDVGAGGVTFLPYLAGELHPINDPQARALFAGLSIETTVAHLARAVMEGSAGAIAHNLEVIAEVATMPSALRATGAPTESTVWCQSIADATGITVETVAADGAPLGDAVLAAATTDAEAIDLLARHVSVLRRYQPDPAATAAARERRRLTAALYQTTVTKEAG
jgi:xylulokinase